VEKERAGGRARLRDAGVVAIERARVGAIERAVTVAVRVWEEGPARRAVALDSGDGETIPDVRQDSVESVRIPDGLAADHFHDLGDAVGWLEPGVSRP